MLGALLRATVGEASTSGRYVAAAAAGWVAGRAGYSSAAVRPGVLGAVVMERLPQVAPELPEWATKAAEWREEWHAGSRKRVEGEQFEEKEASAIEEESLATSWTPAPRVTEADEANDVKSLRRKMDRRLYLLVRSKDDAWNFPSAQALEGESIRSTAERALASTVGGSVESWFVGNSPMGHLPQDDATTFYMKAQIIDGDVTLKAEGGASDHAWVAKEELAEYLKQPGQVDLLKKMLPDL